MIPRAIITEWRHQAPWKTNEQVEQDLLICRIIIELYSNDAFASNYVFRGGTALHKLYLLPQARYSEDIDLVQINPEPIGKAIDYIRKTLEPIMGQPKIKQKQRNNTIIFSTISEIPPQTPIKLKIEINCREHLTSFTFHKEIFSVTSRWFTGKCKLTTFTLEELLGSKLRALYQRKRGRDLFDIWYGLTKKTIDLDKTIKAFYQYMESVQCKVSQKNYLKNLEEKISDSDFRGDTNALLRPELDYNIDQAYKIVKEKLILKLK
ncbi:MAG: nucleotidyl transferase AbiEii/AbiGii toxin family protein [Candidatus Omnitrophica bacterium]|nr:nucleotidyl transferase AbiEii/AbiGii toxin family protein [Candidatus Omnitrophota bacterium]